MNRRGRGRVVRVVESRRPGQPLAQAVQLGVQGTHVEIPTDMREVPAAWCRGYDPGEARAMTVYVLPPLAGGADVSAAAPVELIARIRVGAGGASDEFECDVGRGLRVTVFGSDVSVTLRTVQNVPTPPTVFAGAFIAQGSSSSPKPPTRTLEFAGLTSGSASPAQRRPRHSSHVRIYREPQLAFTLRIQDLAAAVIGRVSVGLNEDSPLVTLPNDASHIVLVNDSGTTTMTRSRCVFELDV